MRELGVLVPTQRPANAARLWQAMQATCTAQTTLILGVDEDDPALGQYPPGPGYLVRGGTHFVTAWCNELAAQAAPEHAFIGTLGDDNVPLTRGWDSQVIAALREQPFAFANDEYPHRAPGVLSCHIFMRSEVRSALGYFGPPEIGHLYVDVAWMAWGIGCGYRYLHDVRIPHLHWSAGAAPHDGTYARSAARQAQDLAAWHAYSRREGPGGLNGDITALGGTPFTRDSLARFSQALGIPEA